MGTNPLSVHDLKKHLELKAYTYGVSPTVSTLLGEYLIELLTKPYYVRHTEKSLVQKSS